MVVVRWYSYGLNLERRTFLFNDALSTFYLRLSYVLIPVVSNTGVPAILGHTRWLLSLGVVRV